MAKPTIYQRLTRVLSNGDYNATSTTTLKDITNVAPNEEDKEKVLFATTDKEEYDRKLLQARQQHLLAMQWKRTQYDLTNRSLMGLNEVKLMYRDADLMDTFPEIGAALDIYADEACQVGQDGFMLNITSKSERVKSILQDLFVNRLSIHITLPMICRSTCKYGNTFMLLNVDENDGIIGWKQLPVHEIERYENGMDNPYQAGFAVLPTNPRNEDLNDDSTKFVWVGQSDYKPYRNWQIAHFRLLYDSLLLPYGVSALHKARRHFRMLSMMEDMMLIYRLERSIDRRVFKINVGAIDEADVPAYVQQIADNFKRTPIVDPQTGQLDLRMNVLNQMEDFFIPVRDDNAQNPIETLNAANNEKAVDDIKYIQKKVLAAMRLPRAFLNFDEAEGDGNNLALEDVRFSRTVNRIQQTLIMELNKVAIIHLYLLGFTDDLTNFTITMNNPSTNAEMLAIDNLAKKIDAAKNAVSDAGGGIPLMSLTRAWKEILKWSDKEISSNLEEMRLEKALSTELAQTPMIIQRTHIFDPVDNIYGKPGAEYQQQQGGDMNGDGMPDMGGGLGGSFGGGLGGGLDLDGDGMSDTGGDMNGDGMPDSGGGDMNGDGMPDMGGTTGAMPMDQAATESGAGATAAPAVESVNRFLDGVKAKAQDKKGMLNEEFSRKARKYTDMFEKRVAESYRADATKNENVPLYNKHFLINEELNTLSKQLDEILHK